MACLADFLPFRFTFPPRCPGRPAVDLPLTLTAASLAAFTADCRARVVGDGEVDGLQALDLVALSLAASSNSRFSAALRMSVRSPSSTVWRLPPTRALSIRAVDAGHVGVALVEARQDVVDVLADGLGGDAVRHVVGALLLAPAVGLAHGALHRAGDPVPGASR